MIQDTAQTLERHWIALDGPSGSGKSSAAKGLAQALGWQYLDTGATYRATTIAALEAGVELSAIDPTDPGGSESSRHAGARVLAALDASQLRSGTDPAAAHIFLGQRCVDAEIRGPEATRWVSAVASVPTVRARLVAYQRAIALRHREPGIVVEGRDIAAVVLPEAALKVYITASAQARARRRAGDAAAVAAGGSSDLAATATDLARRDAADATRADTPAVVPPGVTILDTSELDLQQTIDVLLSLYREVDSIAPAEGV